MEFKYMKTRAGGIGALLQYCNIVCILSKDRLRKEKKKNIYILQRNHKELTKLQSQNVITRDKLEFKKHTQPKINREDTQNTNRTNRK